MTYQAYLYGTLMGEGATEHDALMDAIREYEKTATWDGWPGFEAQEEFVALLKIQYVEPNA